MKKVLGCVAGLIAFGVLGFFCLEFVFRDFNFWYEDTYGRNNVTSPNGKHSALIRSGEEYFHDSVVLDDHTVALSRTFWIVDLRWSGEQTLIVRYLPSDLPNKTGRPPQFDQQMQQFGDVHIVYKRISQADVSKEMQTVQATKGKQTTAKARASAERN